MGVGRSLARIIHAEPKTPPPCSRRRERALTLIPWKLAPTHVGGYQDQRAGSETGAPARRLQGLGNVPLLDGSLLENLVSAAAAITLQIEGDVGVADLFQGGSHFCGDAVLEEFGEFGGTDFDASQKCGR